MNQENQTNEVRVKPYSIKELCVIYGVCRRTMATWLVAYQQDLGKKHGRYYTVRQVETIFEKLGVPYVLMD